MRENSAQSLICTLRSASPNHQVIKSIRRLPSYNDEPKLHQYVVEFISAHPSIGKGSDVAYGTAFEKNRALLKALCEAIERRCISGTFNDQMLVGSAIELGRRTIALDTLRYFNPLQFSGLTGKAFNLGLRTRLQWIKAQAIDSKRTVLIPAQLVYLSNFKKKEAIIRFPDSTGAACGESWGAAVCRGILEVFERDAYMCWFFTRSEADRLEIESCFHPQLRKIYQTYRRYRLELVLLKLPTDLGVHVILAAIIDRTGIGPALTVGLKADYDPVQAVVGAVAEAQQSRPWLRDLMHTGYKFKRNQDRLDIQSFQDRAMYWADLRNLDKLDPLWPKSNGKCFEKVFTKIKKPQNWNETLASLTRTCKQAGMNAYVVNVTSAIAKSLSVFVAKAVVPEAQPVYFDERYPYLGTARLRIALNNNGSRWGSIGPSGLPESLVPHPFV
jgi:ribosomal protein S12 methylthiotransferase accessory factor